MLELDRPADVAAVAEDWDRLVAAAARPNVFLEREVFAAGWRTFGDPNPTGDPVRVLLVMRRGQATQFPDEPIGLFAVSTDRGFGRLCGPVLSMWRHKYAYDATPLLHRGETVKAVDALFRWCDARGEINAVRFDECAGDGPLAMALAERTRVCPANVFEVDRYNRALLRPRRDAETYLTDCVSSRTRRELRRQWRRLCDVGAIETTIAATPEQASAWVDEFLRLEARGWKSGTAIGAELEDVEYLRSVVSVLAAEGRFEGLTMTLDGRPIAMKMNFSSSPGAGGVRTAVAFKIAYDETFQKFSPGVQLELETVRRFHEQSALQHLDSCASAAHPMIDRLWGDRTSRMDVVVSLGGWRADAAVGLRQAARWLRRRLRPRRGRPKANF